MNVLIFLFILDYIKIKFLYFKKVFAALLDELLESRVV